jgi:hypothetical protein
MDTERRCRRGRLRAPSRRTEAGGALLEFAATLPLLFGVLLAMVDFSSYLHDRTVLTAAAYNGAKAGAKATPCGNVGATRGAVEASVTGMLSVPGRWSLEETRTSGPADVRRYLVTVRFDRTLSMMSAFTASIPAFETVRMTGVALCE